VPGPPAARGPECPSGRTPHDEEAFGARRRIPSRFAFAPPRHYAHTVPDRRKAILGYVTWFIASRVARRVARKKVADVTPDALQDGGKGTILMKTKSAPMAVADRATGLVEAVRPVVQRAMHDPELHAALRQAFDTGREVTVTVKGKPPKKAAERLARDRKLQRKVETSASELRDALAAVVQEPKKQKGTFRRIVAPVAVVAGVGAAVFVFLRKRGGGIGSEETPY
jgi:hypothetical protein